MILMKEMLCWSFEDIRYLKLNARKTKTEIKPETRRGLERIMAPDYKLYYYFKSAFDQKIKNFGAQRMQRELKELRKINQEIRDECKFEEAANKDLPKDQKMWGFGNMWGFKVKILCQCVFILF